MGYFIVLVGVLTIFEKVYKGRYKAIVYRFFRESQGCFLIFVITFSFMGLDTVEKRKYHYIDEFDLHYEEVCGIFVKAYMPGVKIRDLVVVMKVDGNRKDYSPISKELFDRVRDNFESGEKICVRRSLLEGFMSSRRLVVYARKQGCSGIVNLAT